MAADPRGKLWKKAQAFAKQGSYGRAKHNVEKGGGTWSLDMSRSLRKTGDYTSWQDPPDSGGGSGGGSGSGSGSGSPDTEALQSSVDNLIAELARQQQEQANALAQQQSAFQAQQQAQRDRDARMKPSDASNALNSTILSGSDWWKKRRSNRNTFLRPFASIFGGS